MRPNKAFHATASLREAARERRRWASMFRSLIPALVALTATGAGCTPARGPVDHTVAWDNVGADVTAFQIRYGDIAFPQQPDQRLRAKTGKQYTATMLVPDKATVEWVSSSGNHHAESVLLYSQVQDKAWFDGDGEINFEIENETLRVYLVRNLPNFKEERSQIH